MCFDDLLSKLIIFSSIKNIELDKIRQGYPGNVPLRGLYEIKNNPLNN